MGKFLRDEDIPKPELVMFSLNQLSIPLGEYMREVMIVSRQCGIRFEMKDNGDRYRFDFYLHESLIMGPYVRDWCTLIGVSDMFIMSVQEGLPQTIRVSFYRGKEETEK